jgi:hypothetical protein
MDSPYAVGLVQKHFPKLHREEISARLSYSTYVNPDRKYMYFEVPKSGCTSIKWLLHSVEKLPPVQLLTGSREVRRDMFIHERGLFGMRSLVDFPNETQEEILSSPDFFRFTVVRNPYTRLESAWRDKIRLCAPKYEHLYYNIKGRLPDGRDPSSIISFDEFVSAVSNEDLEHCDPHWRSQKAHLLMPSFEFSYIGRIERFGEAKRMFLTAIGEPQEDDKPGMNASGVTSNYNDALAKAVYKLYQYDFESFGYSCDSWPRGSSGPDGGMVPERLHVDEIIERNIILGSLYEAHDQLSKRFRVKPEEYLERYRNRTFEDLFTNFIEPTAGWLAREEAALLFNLAKTIKDGCIVEVGSYCGRSATALAMGSIAGHMSPVYCIEPHEKFTGPFGGQFGPIDRGHFMRRMVELGLFHIVRLVNLPSELLASSWPMPVKLLWIDGDHRFDSVQKDFRAWQNKLDEEATVVFDDAGIPGGGPHRLVTELLQEGNFVLVGAFGKTVQLQRRKVRT